MSSQDHPVAVMQIQWVCIHNKQSLEFFVLFFFLRENSLELLPWEDPSPSLQAQVALPNTKGLSTPNSWAWRLWDATSCSNPKQRREEWTGCILLYLLWLSMVSLTIVDCVFISPPSLQTQCSELLRMVSTHVINIFMISIFQQKLGQQKYGTQR